MREFEDNLQRDEHAALGAPPPLAPHCSVRSFQVAKRLIESQTLTRHSPPHTVHQQDDLHAASIAKQHADAQAAAKSRLVEAITQAKVGKAVQLVAAPHI